MYKIFSATISCCSISILTKYYPQYNKFSALYCLHSEKSCGSLLIGNTAVTLQCQLTYVLIFCSSTTAISLFHPHAPALFWQSPPTTLPFSDSESPAFLSCKYRYAHQSDFLIQINIISTVWHSSRVEKGYHTTFTAARFPAFHRYLFR